MVVRHVGDENAMELGAYNRVLKELVDLNVLFEAELHIGSQFQDCL